MRTMGRGKLSMVGRGSLSSIVLCIGRVLQCSRARELAF